MHKVFVYCLGEESADVRALSENHPDWDIEFCKRNIENPKHDQEIIVSHAVLHLAKKTDFEAFGRVWILYRRQLFDARNTETLKKLRQEMLDKKDWAKAKDINEVLSDADFILKNKICNSMPDYLQIETTSFCNAKCIMCSHYFSDNKGAECLKDNTVDCLEDALCLSRTISLNGMGEPFTSPDVCGQIDHYVSLGNRIVTNTNLSVLNDKLIDQINRYFDWLEISVDGCEKDSYESIRRNLKYEVIRKNLSLLKERCPGVRKHIATVIMRQNVKEMPNMVELAVEAGAKVITFMTLNANIIIGNMKDEMSNYPKVLEYYSARALDAGERLGIDVVVPNANLIDRSISLEDIQEELTKMNQLPLYKTSDEEQKMMRTASVVDKYLEENDEIQRDTVPSEVKCSGICDWVLKRSYVDLKGNAAMCCRNQSFHMGNVNDEGCFEKVWNGSFYQKVREIFYSGYVPQSCLKCGLIESGNLKYLEVEMSGEFYKDPPYKVRQKNILKGLLEEEQ